jgi:hypothetical protein
MNAMIRVCPGLGAVVLMVLAAGCSRGTGNVSGTVKFKGKPLPAGTISFYDEVNGVASSPIDPDGSYSVSKVAAGTARITVAVPMPIRFVSPGMSDVKADLPAEAKRTPSIPTRYYDPAQSGLTCEVVRGDQTQDFDLQP